MKLIKDFLIPTVVLTVICLVCSALVVGTYQLTLPIIEARQAREADEARAQVLSGADSFDKVELPAEMDGVVEIYKAKNDTGYVVTTTAKGYGGEMKVMTGIDKDGKISGVKLLSHAETPGLGSRVGEEPFLSQFIGKDSSLSDIEAIVGSTVSSEAFKSAVETAFKAYGAATGSVEEETADPKLELFPDSQFEPIEAEGLTEGYQVQGKNAYVLITEVKGYGGPMQVMTGIGEDGKIVGVRLLENEETAGVGSKVGKPDFTDRFEGLSSAEAVDGVETISGATVSSSAFKQAVSDALGIYNTLTGGSNNATDLPADIKNELFPAPSFEAFEAQGAVEAYKVSGGQGLIFVTEVEGYGGPMRVMTGFDRDGKIVGVRLLENSETSGVGSKVGKTEYTDQFVGLTSAEGVETIAGATVSSTAFKEAVQMAVELFATNKGVLA